MAPRDHLKGVQPAYDVIVIGSGLAGLTAANRLGRAGHSVLLCEHHYQLGGLATFFRRRGRRIFDISLHGFPYGMKKACRKYWSKEIADDIVRVHGIRFENPQYQITTEFDRQDFTRLMVEEFRIAPEKVEGFFEEVRGMDFYDRSDMTTAELFEKWFPGRNDVVRFLMEPITYANGSTPEDPAISYGIVFSNFMSKGCYIYQGGTDKLLRLMRAELEKNGVDIRILADVQQVIVEGGLCRGVVVNGKEIRAKAVVSNANLLQTIHGLVGDENFSPEFIAKVDKVRLNNSSTQVYLGLADGATIPNIGDLLFTSTHPVYDYQALLAHPPTSRTFSVYYPSIRPGVTPERTAIVSSTNAWWEDWQFDTEEEYRRAKEELIEDTIRVLEEKYLPGIREKIEWKEAATPRTFKRYTRHWGGASFGTKFEGLEISMGLHEQIPGLYHAGSVGIIMSGWLGTVNYGVIQAHNVEKYLHGVRTAELAQA
ncbi:MAG: NAD(P)/FAD-dependent oxidoreductase [Planctomycetota bacterium]|nr:MAG: NAD(P)/FAD-dependent oxidoreductase [Planctomycetota bacterium]